MAQLGLSASTLRSPVTPRAASSYSGFILPSSPSSSSSSAASDTGNGRRGRRRRKGQGGAGGAGGGGDDDDDAAAEDTADEEESLPFPTALARRDFLGRDFHAATYLSELHSGPAARHQTLEDLRAELRDRSAAISAELLELVNANYTSFLGLGDELKGGDDRIEDLRVALLGFRRAVEEIQARVRERRDEVGRLCGDLRQVRGGVELGRRMLELNERVESLEARLLVKSVAGGAGKASKPGADDWAADLSGEDEEEDEDEEDTGHGFVGNHPGKLMALAKEYKAIELLTDSIGKSLSLTKKISERMAACRNTMLLDLSTALKEARRAGSPGELRVLRYLAIYRDLGADAEAVRILKEA